MRPKPRLEPYGHIVSLKRILQMTAERIQYSLKYTGLIKTLCHAFWGALDTLEGAAFDWRRGTDTGGLIPLEELHEIASRNRIYGVRHQPSAPRTVRRMLSRGELQHDKYTFIDYGSGKGRALLIAGEYTFQDLVGVEFSPELQRICAANFRRTLPGCNVQLVCCDVVDYRLPVVPTVVFLYHPFQETVMRQVLKNIENSWLHCPRDLWVMYSNPTFRQLFTNYSFLNLVFEARAFAIYRSRTRP